MERIPKNFNAEEFEQTTWRYIQSYLEETRRYDWTIEDVANNYKLYPVWIEGNYVAVFGCYFSKTKRDNICTITLLYVDRPYRHNFRAVLASIADYMRDWGVTRVWISADRRTAKIYRIYFHKEPESEMFEYGFDEICKLVDKWERSHG